MAPYSQSSIIQVFGSKASGDLDYCAGRAVWSQGKGCSPSHLLPLFKRMLQRRFAVGAPEMFCGLPNLTQKWKFSHLFTPL